MVVVRSHVEVRDRAINAEEGVTLSDQEGLKQVEKLEGHGEEEGAMSIGLHLTQKGDEELNLAGL